MNSLIAPFSKYASSHCNIHIRSIISRSIMFTLLINIVEHYSPNVHKPLSVSFRPNGCSYAICNASANSTQNTRTQNTTCSRAACSMLFSITNGRVRMRDVAFASLTYANLLLRSLAYMNLKKFLNFYKACNQYNAVFDLVTVVVVLIPCRVLLFCNGWD